MPNVIEEELPILGIDYDPNIQSSDNTAKSVLEFTNPHRYHNFNRFYLVDPDTEMTNLISYVFITRPDLNLLDLNGKLCDNVSSDPYFNYLYNLYPDLVRALTRDFSNQHDFIPFLQGRVESFQIPDKYLKSQEITQPFTGYKITYAGNAMESMTNTSFDITFRDDNEMSILKYFEGFIHYIDGVVTGKFDPRREYIESKITGAATIMDYPVSIYEILCKPEASEIVYFHKTTGCWPSSVPHSNNSFNFRGGTENKVTITFQGGFPEPLSIYSLKDFNKNSINKNGNSQLDYEPTFNPKTLESYSYVGSPFIKTMNLDGTLKYYLKWLKN